MKRIVIIILSLLVIASCVGLTACGGGGGEKTTSEETQAQTQVQSQKPITTSAAATSTKPTSESSGSWGIPIYPGSKEVMKVKSDKNETLNDKPAVIEMRTYTSSDKKDKVVAWYQDKMPANGWTETMTSEIGGGMGFMGGYEKNDGDEVAGVTCSEIKDGGTMIKLDWKYVK